MKKTKRIAVIGLCIAAAFILSYIETLIPLGIPVPGIKIGLANVAVVTALYTLGKNDAFFISMVRILISGLVFSGAFSLLYSFAGGIASFVIMALLSIKKEKFSVCAVSVSGAMTHNLAQIAVAALVMQTKAVAYYIFPLLLCAILCGICIGMLSGLTVKRLLALNK